MNQTAVTADTYIRYNARNHDYEVYSYAERWAGAELIASAKDYFTAEQKRTAYLAERLGRAKEARG